MRGAFAAEVRCTNIAMARDVSHRPASSDGAGHLARFERDHLVERPKTPVVWAATADPQEPGGTQALKRRMCRAIEGEGRQRRGQDAVEVVPALLRDPARRQVVHLVQEFKTLQPVGSEGVEGPAGESLQSAGATPSPRACAAVQ
ncbi:hypothetical protein SCMC78_52270 [Streptomyces sp. CMC78]|uniref:Uncharacterized protein n=1 Tax=Streptomyces sp. CMC78 TaxID=3231512 RepID=A0AB33KUG3_9ACTN